jgi:RNA polymerase sigma factor (sigma-70 family)
MWLISRKRHRSDEELLADYHRGDRDAAGLLFERYATTVYGVCLFYFREREKARDGVMQIFEKLLMVLKKEKVAKFSSWLSSVCRNHCISELRKSKQGVSLPEAYLDFETKETTPEAEERLERIAEDIMLSRLEECLPLLNERQRDCVTDFYIRGLSYKEISALRGYPPAEVKSHIQNGKRNLKLMIEEKTRNEKTESH